MMRTSLLLLLVLLAAWPVWGDEVPKLRQVDEPTIELEGGAKRINTKFYRGERLILEQSIWQADGQRERYSQTVWIDDHRALTVSRTHRYHFRRVGNKDLRLDFEEVDLDRDGDWDVLLFEDRVTTEAFTVDSDGFLTPVTSQMINEANAKMKEDGEWLLKQLAKELKQSP